VREREALGAAHASEVMHDGRDFGVRSASVAEVEQINFGVLASVRCEVADEAG
jgi:hypothetical protein